MKLADKTQICYVVTRERFILDDKERYGEVDEVIPCAVFTGAALNDAQDTADAYNQKFKDDGIEGYLFKVHCTAIYD